MSDNDKKESNGNGSPQVGALLRASRLRVGEDLREIADILCIRYLYLEAIEDCRYGDLPGSTYAVGFIRSYAEHLGLDGEEVVRRFKAEQAGSKRADALSFPTPVPESGMPKGAIVFIGVLLGLLVYGGWYVTTTDESILDNLISPVPDHLKNMVNGSEAQKQTATTAPVAPETAADTPAETQVETQAETPVAPQAEAPTEAPVESSAPVAETPSEKTEPAPVDAAVVPSEPPAPAPAPEPVSPSASVTVPKPSETVAPAPVETPAVSAPSAPVAPATTPAETATPAPTPSAEADTTETATPAPTSTATPVETANAPHELTAEELNAQSLRRASGTPTAKPKPAAEPIAAVAPPAAAPVAVPTTGVVVRATESSWVEIRNPADGKILFTGLMSAGKFFAVPNISGLVLDTGNAGGLDITVEGVSAPKIGGAGIVRKGVALDPARLLAGTATSR